MDPKNPAVNYLYFGFSFLFLVLLVASSIFTKENLSGSQFFFFLYAIGQVILEISLFIFLGLLIRKYLGKICFALFVAGTFVALVLHLFDFIADRILDLSIWETIKIFVLEENWANFFYLLDASGLPLWTWLLLFFAMSAFPFLGVGIYKISEKLTQKKPIVLRNALFLQTFLCIPCALLFWDYSASRIIHPDAYTAFITSLPWKFTFLQPESIRFPVAGPIRKPFSESSITAAIEQNTTVLVKRPNIYLFIIESLREDAITAEIAPHLHQFKATYAHSDMALSNANGSHLSWFSIFHSQFPFHWQSFQKHWSMGSPALNLLKKWGYQVRLYTSAQLGYYGMEELLFGKKLHLLDSRQTFHHAPPLQAADTDAAALAKLQKDLAENPELQQGQLFIIFWDCTHFDYSWPKTWSPKFTPFAQELAYFKAFQSQKTIGLIKNRYRNAVHYMDTLFGRFFDQLPNKEEAIVVVTGDHGEEFFEHGHLFHNSHLTREQTHVPLYFKMRKPIPSRKMISQMDIFPTLIDDLSDLGDVPFLEGNSLFQEPKRPFVVTARFNAGRTPYEFCIHNGTHKLIAQFANRSHIFDSEQLRIRSLRTCDDRSLCNLKGEIKPWIEREFGAALNCLFQSRFEDL